jgi:hypothetical protein
VNLDYYREACAQLDQLVILLGEGTFHQFHGGVATNVPIASHPGNTFLEEYQAIRGRPFAKPTRHADYLGGIVPQSLPFLAASISAAATPNSAP